MTAKGRERLAWGAVALWTGVLYAAVPMARGIQSMVAGLSGGREPFVGVVAVVVAMSAASVAVAIWRRHGRDAWRRLSWLGAAGGVLLWMAVRCTGAAVEAIHFIEYGILGVLLYRAFACRVHDPSIYVLATLAGCLAGVVDEVLQWLTPDRVFDLRDAGFNASAVALVQLAIARGVAPTSIREPVGMASVRLSLRWLAAVLLIVGACLANTPARVAWYSERVSGLAFLRSKPEVMVEYGYRHRDPGIGIFYSRLTIEQLGREDRERGGEVGAILERWRPHSRYLEFLKIWRPEVDPFLHEARVHLFARDHHWGLLQREGEKLGAGDRVRHAAIAFREEQLLEKYWSNTLVHAQAAWGRSKIERVRGQMEENSGKPHVSSVSRHVITGLDDVQLPVGFFALAVLCLAGDLFLGRACRRKQRAGQA